MGIEGLIKREVAGPVPFWISEIWNIRGEKTREKGGILADCPH